MADQYRDDNEKLIAFLNEILDNGTHEVASLRRKLTVTYWVIVVLSVIMFAAGLWLIIAPAVAAMQEGVQRFGPTEWTQMGGGFLDLIALHLSRPVNHIQRLMGDIAQMTLAINSFRYQVALRLLEMEMKDRSSVGAAADHIRNSATASMWLIAQHFESKLDDHEQRPVA